MGQKPLKASSLHWLFWVPGQGEIDQRTVMGAMGQALGSEVL